MQELMEDFVLVLHTDHVLNFSLINELYFYFRIWSSGVFVFSPLSLSLFFSLIILRSLYWILGQKCFLVYVTELIQGNSVKSRHLWVESP